MKLAVYPIGFPKTKMYQGNWYHAAIFDSEQKAKAFCREWVEEVLDYDRDFFTEVVIPRSEIENLVLNEDSENPLIPLIKDRMSIPFKELWHATKGYFLVREF